jgi:hypothetical protein
MFCLSTVALPRLPHRGYLKPTSPLLGVHCYFPYSSPQTCLQSFCTVILVHSLEQCVVIWGLLL